METSNARLLVATRTLIEHLVEKHSGLWDAEKRKLVARLERRRTLHLPTVENEFDALVRDRLYAFQDEVSSRTATEIASCESIEPCLGLIEHFQMQLEAWCDALEAERRETIDAICDVTLPAGVIYQHHNHLLTKAYRATIEQERSVRWPNQVRRRMKSAISAAVETDGYEFEERIDRSAPSPEKPSTAPQPRKLLPEILAGQRWPDVGIQFVAEDALQFKSLIKKNCVQRFTYAELGFKDGRKGDLPNLLWDILKDVVANGGVLGWTESTKYSYVPAGWKSCSPKNFSRLGKTLKIATGIAESPFKPYVRKTNEQVTRLNSRPTWRRASLSRSPGRSPPRSLPARGFIS